MFTRGGSMKLRVGLIQMISHKYAIKKNLQFILEIIVEAVHNNIDILCFPEMSLTGYSDPKDTSVQLSVDAPFMQELLNYTKNLTIIILIGLIEKNFPDKPFITQLAIQHGKITHQYRKMTIIDDEVHWFSAGKTVKPVILNDIPTGMTNCADIESEFIFSDYAKQGAKIIFESAAPGLNGPQETRNWETGYSWWKNFCIDHFGKYSKENKLWILVATQAGRTIDEDFSGGGFVFSPDGELLYSTPNEDPCRIYLEVDLDNKVVKELLVLY